MRAHGDSASPLPRCATDIGPRGGVRERSSLHAQTYTLVSCYVYVHCTSALALASACAFRTNWVSLPVHSCVAPRAAPGSTHSHVVIGGVQEHQPHRRRRHDHHVRVRARMWVHLCGVVSCALYASCVLYAVFAVCVVCAPLPGSSGPGCSRSGSGLALFLCSQSIGGYVRDGWGGPHTLTHGTHRCFGLPTAGRSMSM